MARTPELNKKPETKTKRNTTMFAVFLMVEGAYRSESMEGEPFRKIELKYKLDAKILPKQGLNVWIWAKMV